MNIKASLSNNVISMQGRENKSVFSSSDDAMKAIMDKVMKAKERDRKAKIEDSFGIK
jgi:hypothetical protein